MLFIKQQFFALNKTICYVESNFVICNTSLVSLKFKLTPMCILLMNDATSVYNLNISLFNTYALHSHKQFSFSLSKLNYLFSMLTYIFTSAQFGITARFRLIGRGYKVFPLINTYMYKLGFSHSIYYTLPISIRFRKKLKKMMFYRVLGIWPHKVNLYLNEIKSFRLPDVYCAKGIFEKNQYFVKKEGKKAFTL